MATDIQYDPKKHGPGPLLRQVAEEHPSFLVRMAARVDIAGGLSFHQYEEVQQRRLKGASADYHATANNAANLSWVVRAAIKLDSALDFFLHPGRDQKFKKAPTPSEQTPAAEAVPHRIQLVSPPAEPAITPATRLSAAVGPSTALACWTANFSGKYWEAGKTVTNPRTGKPEDALQLKGTTLGENELGAIKTHLLGDKILCLDFLSSPPRVEADNGRFNLVIPCPPEYQESLLIGIRQSLRRYIGNMPEPESPIADPVQKGPAPAALIPRMRVGGV